MLTQRFKVLCDVLTDVPLRLVLAVPFVLSTLGGATLIGYLSYWREQEAIANLGQQLLRETTDRITQELQTDLHPPQLINQLNVDVSADAVNLPFEGFNHFLQQRSVSRFTHILILDADGVLIATSDPSQFDHREVGSNADRSLPFNGKESQDDFVRSLGKYLQQHGETPAAANQSQFLELHQNGERQFVSITPYQNSQGLDWRIVTVLSSSYFKPLGQDNLRDRVLFYGLVWGIATGVGLFATQQVRQRFGPVSPVGRGLATDPFDRRWTTDLSRRKFKSLTHQDRRDRQASELVLQRSEAQYRAILEDQTELITRCLPDTTLVFVNHAYCRYFGLDREAIIGKSYQPVIYEADQDRVAQLLQAMSFENPTVTIENRVVVNGEIRWTQWINRLLFDDQGNVAEIQSVGRDITQLKQIEAALRKSEANLLQSQQIAHVGSWEVDLMTQEIIWSEELFRILGLDPTQTKPGHPQLIQLIPAEDQKTVATAINQLVTKGEPYEVEHLVCRPDGSIRSVISKGQAVLNRQQQVLKLYGTVLDITDRKQLEQSLRSQAEEERLLATITQNIRQSLDLEQILATTVIEVQQTLKADRALIFRLNSDGSGQVIQDAVIPGYPLTDQMRWENEPFPQNCDEYYQQGYPRIVSDVATDTWAGCPTGSMSAIGVQSKIVAPIVQTKGHAATVWGLLIVHACATQRQWQDSEAAFLQRICNQLAIAIDQANLYQQLQAELAEHKRTEQVLQEREAMLRAIGDNLPKGFIYQRIYEPGKGSYYSYVSAGVERLLGLKPEAILADSKITRTIGFEEDLAQADQVAQESLRNLTPIELQMRNRSPQGEVRWSSIRSTPRRLEDGRTVWDGVEVDITDLKRAEAALRTSEEQFRRAFDDAPIGVSLVALTGQFVKVNACYCDLLGYTEAELLQLTFQDITHPADVEADQAGLQRMLAGEIRAFQLQKRYISKQGHIIPVLMNAALIRDQNGQPLYSVGHIQDIRERLKVERMKHEFISVISHELRTPLTSIQGALDLLGSGIYVNRPEKAQQMLKIAINNSDRLVRLVNDILVLERLESGKVSLVMESCQVTDLMQQAIEGIQAIADQSAITLCCTSLSATIWAAPDAMIQALTNLLSNAIKFSAPGHQVWLKAERRDSETCLQKGENDLSPYPLLLFTVQDQGRGIPADKLEIIFEQFQQVDVSDSCKKGGTGLGLAICKNIVQQHGGRIWVESILGQGSSFYIALPIKRKDKHD